MTITIILQLFFNLLRGAVPIPLVCGPTNKRFGSFGRRTRIEIKEEDFTDRR
jgi:hypothetical protein